MIFWLVVSTPLKNMKVSWGYYSQYMEKLKCSKPPTSIGIYWFILCSLHRFDVSTLDLDVAPADHILGEHW
jgi:hypothetical protein